MSPTLDRVAAAAVAGLLAIASPARAAQPVSHDDTPHFALEIGVHSLQVEDVGGILILRGQVREVAQAAAAGRYAQLLGYSRIANLIVVTGPIDDADIERRAERELAFDGSLDGCRITIVSNGGVVQIGGTVTHELQKDMAVQRVWNVEGVKEVRSDLRRF